MCLFFQCLPVLPFVSPRGAKPRYSALFYDIVPCDKGFSVVRVGLTLFCTRFPHRPDFAKVGSMGWRAADGIADARVDRQVEVRAVRTERIAIADSQFIATLPPAMLAHYDARIELFH